MPDCLRCCVRGGRLLQPLYGVVVCGWTETRNSSIQYGRKTFHCNVHRVGTHCTLCLACSGWEETSHSKRDNGCLHGGTGFDRRMGMIFPECVLCVCVCVCVCVCTCIRQSHDWCDYMLNLYYSFPFLLHHCSLWMLMNRNSLHRSYWVLFSWMYRSADKFIARPGRKQATAIEDFDVHVSYL